MDVATFDEIKDEFNARVQRIVWCTVTTIDQKGRPRSRILHPIWDGPTGYIATGRQKHGASSATGERRSTPGTRTHAMEVKLKRAGHRSRYRLRKQTVEPVFGQIKEGRGFRKFLLRGIEKVQGEWSLICAAHNFLKWARAVA